MLYMFFMREVPFHDETLHLKDGTFFEWNLGTSSGGGGESQWLGTLLYLSTGTSCKSWHQTLLQQVIDQVTAVVSAVHCNFCHYVFPLLPLNMSEQELRIDNVRKTFTCHISNEQRYTVMFYFLFRVNVSVACPGTAVNLFVANSGTAKQLCTAPVKQTNK